jgi:purine-binding chemotaxis protein CheW
MSERAIRQYLTFGIDKDRYAIQIERVREVLEYTTIRSLPRSAPYMKGIINLRGSSVAVIDLRERFGMPPLEAGKTPSIIVMETETEEGLVAVGALADSVDEVVELDEIEDAPKFGGGAAAEYLKGLSKGAGGFVAVLDVDALFRDDAPALAAAESA